MTPNEITNLVTTVGFPICAFLLVYLDLRRKLEELTKAVNELAKKVT